MSPLLNHAIIKTLAYSDVFDYPLKVQEIHKYLNGFKIGIPDLLKELKFIPGVKEKNSFYFLKSREKIVDFRSKKEKISLKKLGLAKKFASILFLLPSVKVIAVTGSLALLSSGKRDDIDLLVITSRNRIWTGRLFCVLFLKIMGIYRIPGQTDAPNKICLNMFLDEDHLSLPVSERDLYSAHEIVQAKPLFFRHGYSNILLRQNPWVSKFLPNITIARNHSAIIRRNSFNFVSSLVDIFENILKNFQLFYMQPKRTNEVIRDGYLRFHPTDARVGIINSYNLRLKKYLK